MLYMLIHKKLHVTTQSGWCEYNLHLQMRNLCPQSEGREELQKENDGSCSYHSIYLDQLMFSSMKTVNGKTKL